MSDHKTSFMNDQLSKQTSIFGLRLWVVLGISVGAAFVLILFTLSLWFTSRRSNDTATSKLKSKSSHRPTIPTISREIQIDRTQVQPDPIPEPEQLLLPQEDESRLGFHRVHIETGKAHRISYPSSNGSGEHHVATVVPEVCHLGWGHWYTLRKLELATNGFADKNVIGEGGYGIVYHGILEGYSQVAVKNLLNNK